MYQIDMEKFGNFLCTLRKEKNLTQKELGDKLFVSDKTVSKWERGLSIPNVSLLIPIAEILEWSLIYFGCLAAAVLEIGLMAFFGYTYILEGSLLYLIAGLSFIFAMWLCLFAKETLPSYYDENEINFVSVGIMLSAGFTSFRSATKIGYVGNEMPRTWSGTYYYLDGFMEHTMRPKTEPDTLHIDVETEKGSIFIEIEDTDGNIIFSESEIENESFDVEIDGKITVKIDAKKHKGSFSIECE